AAAASHPEWITTWYTGYLVYDLIGALPAQVPERGPWLMDDAARQRLLARVAGGEVAQDGPARRMLQQAEQLLEIDVTPPGEEFLYGNPNRRVDRRWNSALQFRGPGQWYLEKEERLLTPEEIEAT